MSRSPNPFSSSSRYFYVAPVAARKPHKTHNTFVAILHSFSTSILQYHKSRNSQNQHNAANYQQSQHRARSRAWPQPNYFLSFSSTSLHCNWYSYSFSPPPSYYTDIVTGTAHVITIPMETFTVLTPPTNKEKERMEKWSKFVAFCKEMAKFLLKVLIIVGIIAGLTCAVSAAIGSR